LSLVVFSQLQSRQASWLCPYLKEPYLNLNQSYTPIVIGVTGVSLASLAAIFYNRRPQTPPVRFTDADITQRFVSSLPELTAELNLEVATVRQVETFTRSDQRSLLWALLDLGTNTVQVSVPVTYRYQIPLREAWHLKAEGSLVIVQAPALRAALPPAIHTDQLVTLSVRGWARGSTASLRLGLERQITPSLNRSADDPRRLNLVRDTCRRSVVAFVRLWLEREGQWGAAAFSQIEVKFADELAGPPGAIIKNPRVVPDPEDAGST
jgi:hypothetical protein